MRNVRILPYKAGSQSAGRLSAALGTVRISLSNSIISDCSPKTIINWGNSGYRLPPQGLGEQHTIINPLSCVATAANKLSAFEVMHSQGVRVPDFTTEYEEALEWLEHGKVVVRNTLTGHSGEGIDIADDPDDMVSDAPLYVKYIKKQDEYRVHIMNGEVIDIQRKARSSDVDDEDVNWQVRNHSNGFIYMRNNIDPNPDVIDQARLALTALNLDFGAVDVIWNEAREAAYVLEVNTACGLTGTTLDRYMLAFHELLSTGDVTPLEGYERPRTTGVVLSPEERETVERWVAYTPQYLNSPISSEENTMREWQVGDVVQIAESSGYYNDNHSTNPRDMRGVVIRTASRISHSIRVEWDNGRTNVYNHSDLVAYQEPRTGFRVGDRVRITSDGFGVRGHVGEIGTCTRVYDDGDYAVFQFEIEEFTYYFNQIGGLIELISDGDVQSLPDEIEEEIAEPSEWVVVVNGNTSEDAEIFSSKQEAEAALTSPLFHNLRAMGNTLRVEAIA